MDAAERSLLTSTIQTAIAGAPTTESGIDDVLVGLGWTEMLASEPRDAVEIVFGALGAHVATAGALDDVLMSALGLEPRADAAVVLPPFGRWDAPGRVDGDRLHAVGLGTRRASTAKRLVVVGVAGVDVHVATVNAADAEITPISGIDPEGQWCSIRVDAKADAAAIDGAAWEAAVAAGRRALARQTAGAARTMLGLARAHATDRVQFGRPIAGFQAVRHRLADTLVAIEALEACIEAAWDQAGWDETGSETAALAKAVAGRTSRTVATHCQQVLAGVGFTTDHPFHRSLKQTMMLDGLLGSADELVLDLGRGLLADRTVPTLLEL